MDTGHRKLTARGRPQMGPLSRPSLRCSSFFPAVADLFIHTLTPSCFCPQALLTEAGAALSGRSQSLLARHAGPQFGGRRGRAGDVHCLSVENGRALTVSLVCSKVGGTSGSSRRSTFYCQLEGPWGHGAAGPLARCFPGPSRSRGVLALPGWGILATTGPVPSAPPGPSRAPRCGQAPPLLRRTELSSCPALILGPRPPLHTRSPNP